MTAMRVRVRENKKPNWIMVDVRIGLPVPVQPKFSAKRREQPKKDAPTLREFAPRWLDDYARANKLKPSTVNTYENIRLKLHILPALGALRLSEVDDAALQRLKGRMLELARRPSTTSLGSSRSF
jgi:hypothetical protein